MTALCILMLIDIAAIMWRLSKLDRKIDSIVIALKAQDKFNKSCFDAQNELYELVEQKS